MSGAIVAQRCVYRTGNYLEEIVTAVTTGHVSKAIPRQLEIDFENGVASPPKQYPKQSQRRIPRKIRREIEEAWALRASEIPVRVDAIPETPEQRRHRRARTVAGYKNRPDERERPAWWFRAFGAHCKRAVAANERRRLDNLYVTNVVLPQASVFTESDSPLPSGEDDDDRLVAYVDGLLVRASGITGYSPLGAQLRSSVRGDIITVSQREPEAIRELQQLGSFSLCR